MSDVNNQTELPLIESQPCCSGLTRFAAIGVLLAICGVGYWAWSSQLSDGNPSLTGTNEVIQATMANDAGAAAAENHAADADPNTAAASSGQIPDTDDQKMATAIVGTWETEREVGHRDLVVKADGTAELTVNIDSMIPKLVFGAARMVIDIRWHISDGILNFEMIGGNPKNSVDRLKEIGGESLAYKILELSENRLLVKDGEDDPDHDWNRVK